MAPLRRYLRITKHSVLEVRIYLDRPSDADSWLLKRDNPALPRVIQAIRPLVLPKLREENERAKGRTGSKARKKGVKDVVVEDDFEVSIFLTDHSSRHSVLTKQKIFKDKPRIQSNSGKLTSWLMAGTSDKPLVIDQDSTEPIVVREEEDDDMINLADIPEAGSRQNEQSIRTTRNRRRGGGANEEITSHEILDESAPTRKRRSRNASNRDTDADHDDVQELQDEKKKFGINTSYDGFSIYGRILCLVVKRRGVRTQTGGAGGSGGVPISSQQMLEHWVSTQAAAEQVDDDEDNG